MKGPQVPAVEEAEDDLNEYIVPPGAVETSKKIITRDEPETDPEEEEVEEVVGDEAPAEEAANQEQPAPATETPATETTDDVIEIDGAKYAREELEKMLSIGKDVYEYQKQHPGFDPLLIERDYRHKTHELAQLKQRLGVDPAAPTPTPTQTPAPQPDIDLSDIHPDDVTRIEKILKAKGIVTREELERQNRAAAQQNYEATKAAQLNAFLEKHPEYKPQNDPGDRKWNALHSEFLLFQLPEDPRKIGDLLERAHRSVAGTSLDPKAAARILAQRKTNAVAATASPSGAAPAGSAPSSAKKVDPKLRKFFKGYSDEELDELLS